MSIFTIRNTSFAAGLLGATMLMGVPAAARQATALPDAATASAPGPTVATPANPDQSTAAEPQAQRETAADGASQDIVVTGFRKSYADAISAKRNEIAITDGISSDGLGRFPDLNVGEALQRVPGVQINREAEGRNATINLRGLPGEYARLTLNGVAFAEPILNEAAPLGAFNSDIFSAIVIDKSPLANAQTGGLSGNVDLEIAAALGRKEGGFAKAAYEYNEQGKLGAPAATVGYNHHFSDRFAVFGVLAYKHENFRRDTIQFNNYTLLTAEQAQANVGQVGAYYAPSAVCPSCTGTTTTKGVLYDSQLRQYSRLNEGNLYTGAAGAEWEATDELKLGVTGFYTDRRLPKTYQYINIIESTAASTLSALSTPVSLSDGRYAVTDFAFSNASISSSTRVNEQHQKAWGINGNVNWKNDDWRLNSVFTLSRASNSSLETSVDFVTLQRTGGNGVTGTLKTGGDSIDDFAVTLAPNPGVTTAAPGGWFFGGDSDPTSFYDAAATTARRNRFGLTGTQSYGSNRLAAGQFELERSFNGGILTGIQIGGRFERNKFVSRGFRTSAFGLPVQNIDSNFLVTSPTAGDFFDGHQGATANWQVFDFEYGLPRLQPVTVAPGGELSPIGYNIRYSDNNYSLFNFTNQTDIASGYAQLKYEFTLGGVTFRGNGGLRYEYARNKVATLDRVTLTGSTGRPTDFRTNTYRQNYGKLLPSFIMVADLSDRLVARAAAYKTYVRPQPRQFTPATILSAPTNGIYTLTLGNSALKPYNSTSVDVSVEWYNRPNSLISLAGFQKRITGLIAPITDRNQLCPADGSVYGLGTLTVNGDQCQSSLLYTGGAVPTPFLVVATGFTNQNIPITVRGLEFNFQQSLDFLPGLLKNLGGGFNYAFTDISGTNANGSKATLPGVSRHNANLIAYYETTQYGVRLVYNIRSKYDLASAGTFTGAARQVRARGQFDMSASYNVTDRFSLSFDAYNLANAKRIEYEGDERLARRADYDGRTFTVTARTTF